MANIRKYRLNDNDLTVHLENNISGDNTTFCGGRIERTLNNAIFTDPVTCSVCKQRLLQMQDSINGLVQGIFY